MPIESFFGPLHADHEALRDLFATIAVERDLDEVNGLQKEVQKRLTLHLELEEQILYPALLEVTESWDDRVAVYGAHEDHRLIVHAMHSLFTPSDEDEDGRAHGRIHALEKLWVHHVEEEEAALFCLARRTMDLDDFTSLSDRLATLRERLEREGKDQDIPEPDNRPLGRNT